MSSLVLTSVEENSLRTPISGKVRIFVGPNGTLRTKDSNGVVTTYATGLTSEDVQDIVGSLIKTSNSTNVSYDDANNALYIEVNQGVLDHQNFLNKGTNSHSQIDTHIASTQNPHGTTKEQVGLGNVDNTSDINKPVSTATQDVLNIKITKSTNTIYVNTRNPSQPGDLTSIAAAANLIQNSSENNRYIIEVGPGIYVEPLIVLPPYTSIVGTAIQSVIIKPQGNHDIVHLNTGCEITFVSLMNAPLGKIAIKSIDVGEFSQIHKVSIYDCDIGVYHCSTTIESTCYAEYIDMNGIFTNAVISCSQNGFRSLLNLENFYVFSSGVTTPLIKTMGNKSECVLSVCSIYGTGVETAIEVNDSSYFVCKSIQIFDCDNGVVINNSTEVGRVSIDAIVQNNITSDINIANPNIEGTLRGSFDLAKVTVHPDAKISATYADHGEVGLVILQSLHQGDRHDRLINFSKMLRAGAMTGVISGGDMSYVGTQLTVSAGNGFILDSVEGFVKELTWTTSVLSCPSNSERYIFIDNSGVPTISTTKPMSLIEIPLGRIMTDSSSICLLEQTKIDVTHYNNLNEDFLRNALGCVLSSGMVATINTNNQKLNVTSGSYYFGTKKLSVQGSTPIDFEAYYKNGTGGYVGLEDVLSVDCLYYDNGSGTLQAMTSGYYAKHLLYAIGGDVTKYFLVYSQAQYSTLPEAQAGSLPIPPQHLKDAVIHVASVIVEQSTNSIKEIIDERPQIGFKPSSTSTITDHGDLTGLLDDDHLQYHNDTRGDIRYYTKTQIDTTLLGKSDTGHHHTSSEITDFVSAAQSANTTALSLKADKSTTLTAGTGLSGGGDLSQGRTFSIASTGVTASSYGSASKVSTFSVNAQGQLTAANSVDIAIASTQVSDFTEAAQDAIGSALADGTNITFSYNDVANQITANLTDVVTAGTYGSSTSYPIITVDAKGRVTSVSTATPASSWIEDAVSLSWSNETAKYLKIRQAYAENSAPTIKLVSSRGSLAVPSAIVSGDKIGSIGSFGWSASGENTLPSAAMNAYATESHTSGAQGAELVVEITPNGTTTPVKTGYFKQNGDFQASGCINIGSSSDTTNGNIKYSNSEFVGRQAGSWVVLAQSPTYLFSTAAATTTAASFSTISGMTTTPAAGVYRVDFTCSAGLSANNSVANFGLFIAGVEQAQCRRTIANGAATAVQGSVAISTIITVNGSQVVDIRFQRTSGGATVTANARELLLTPISR